MRFLLRTGTLAGAATLAAVSFAAIPARITSIPQHGSVSTVQRVKHWLQTGQASWYGLRFQGHKTATGEKFDMNSMTCAHRTLPLGSWVRVTNTRNSKSVFVRVNDRGPVPGDRIIDLSYAAAQAVGLGGLGKVKLEPLQPGNDEMARALIAQLSDRMAAPALPVTP